MFLLLNVNTIVINIFNVGPPLASSRILVLFYISLYSQNLCTYSHILDIFMFILTFPLRTSGLGSPRTLCQSQFPAQTIDLEQV